MALAGLLLAAPTAQGVSRHITLAPQTTRISFTVFALGLLPVPANFERFTGTVTQDMAQPGACHIDVAVDVGSLHMDDAQQRRDALGPALLDAGHFPSMHFTGACQKRAIAGQLTLHGVTRLLTLAMHRDGAQVICAGTLARRDYGIVGMADTIAPAIRIQLSVHVPP